MVDQSPLRFGTTGNVIHDHPVLLNRKAHAAPSGNSGILFALVEGRALKLHLLVCLGIQRRL